jgi:threonine synthase
MKKAISGYTYTDAQTRQTMKDVYRQWGYILDPHGAVGYRALNEHLGRTGGKGYFVETAHPAKFKETVDETLGTSLPLPERLAEFMAGEKKSIGMPADYEHFRSFALDVLRTKN